MTRILVSLCAVGAMYGMTFPAGAGAAAPVSPEAAPRTVYTLPCEIHGNLIVVRVRVNRSADLPFLLDTGASSSVVDVGLVGRLGLRAGASGHASSAHAPSSL